LSFFRPASLSRHVLRHAHPAVTRPGEIVSKPASSVAQSQPSVGGFLAVLLLGGLCVLAASLMRDDKLHSARTIDTSIARSKTLVELMTKTATAPVRPSAYDEESAMTPAQLLNRWDGIVNEASRRFNLPKAWIRAVLARESGGRTMLSENQPIISRAGAVGLMQVLHQTYQVMD
jgi:hypothetical protein